MKKLLILMIGFIFFINFSKAEDLEGIRNLEQRKTNLDDRLSRLNHEFYKNRKLEGGTIALLGGGLIALTASSSSKDTGEIDIYYLLGGLYLGLGIYSFFTPSSYEEEATKYLSLSKDPSHSIETKVVVGEGVFAKLAKNTRSARLLNAILWSISGSLFSVVGLAGENRFYLYPGIILTGLGIYNFFSKGKAEVDYENYLNSTKKNLINPQISFIPLFESRQSNDSVRNIGGAVFLQWKI